MASEKAVKKPMSTWELNSKIEKIIDSNMKEIPYEGIDVDKQGLRDSILELVSIIAKYNIK